jgi:hypothetical protein
MQDLRFYLLIEDKEKESEVRIDGNLDTFRVLLYALRADLVNCLPVEDHKNVPMSQEATNAVTT